MKRKHSFRRILPVSALATLIFCQSAHAVTRYWDTNAATGFTNIAGTWDGTNLFWNTDSTGATTGTFVASPSSADDLLINGGATGTITLSGAQQASSFTFAVNVAVTLSGGTSLTLGGTGAKSGVFVNSGANQNNLISSPIILAAGSPAVSVSQLGSGTLTIGNITGSASGTQTLSVGSFSGAITLSGVIGNGLGGGTVALTANSQPTISTFSTIVTTLSNSNSYSGTTTVSSGVLRLSNATALPGGINATGGTSALTINGGVVELANGNFLRDLGTGSAQFQIPSGVSGFSANAAARTVTVNNASSQELVWSSSTFAPSTLVLNDTTANNTLNLTNKIDLNGATRTIAVNANTATISGVIRDSTAGTNGIIKSGAGTLILNQANTFTGPITINGGTVSASATGHLGAAASNLVFNGGTLQITSGLTNFSGLGHTVVFNPDQTVGLDIAGTFTADQALNVGFGGLTKAGAGTLILNQTNTYIGTTTISAGTLRIDDGGSIANSKLIVNNGTLTFNRTSGSITQGTDFSIITGTGAVIQAGAGNLILNNVNTYSGTTTANAGTITVSNALALQNSTLVTTGAGTITLSGVTTPTIGGLSGTTGNLGSANVLGAGYSSVTALTLNPLSGSLTYGGVISDGTLGMTLTKIGAGTQILSGANTYTGATTVNAGTLTVGNSTTGSLNGTTGTDLTIGGTGIFNVAEAASSAQHMKTLAFNATDGTVRSTFASIAANLTIDAAPTRLSGGSGTFVISGGAIGTAAANASGTPGTNNIILTGQATQAAMGVAYFAGTVSGTGYAFYDGAGFVRPIDFVKDTIPLGGSSTQAGGTTIPSNPYVQTTAAITAQTTATFTGLHITGASNFTLAAGQTVTTNGILKSGGVSTISGGTALQAGTGAEMVIRTDLSTDNISLTARLRSLTTATAPSPKPEQALSLSMRCAVTPVAPLSTQVASVNPLGAGTTTVNRAGTLALNRNNFSTPIVLNGGTVTCGNSFSSTLSSTSFTLNDLSTINVTGNLTISANMSGSGGFIKTGGAVVPVTGTDSYTGPTIINGGALKFKTPLSLYNNTPASWTPANITVGSGASFIVNVGGSGEFTGAQASTLLNNLTTGINNNGLLAGSIFGIDVANAGGVTQIVSDNISDSTGPGGGALGFRQFGAGTVELTGTNTYTGQTIADSTGTLRVYSINSVYTNASLGTVHAASSSLGAPNTVANGTILLGTSSTFTGANLTYLGTGETTDRVVNLGGANGTSYTFTQSGTGLLKFTSDFTITDNRGAKTITFTSTTAGTGEMAGIIPLGDAANPNSVTKSGSSTWTFSGANRYTGNTTISAGKLNITNPTSTTGVFIIAANTTLNLGSFSDYGVSSAMGNRPLSSETNSGTDSATSGIGLHITGGTLQYTGSTAQSTNRMIRINNTTTNTIDASGTGSGTLTFTGAVAQVNLFDTGGTRTLNLIGSNTGNNTFGIALTDQSTNATSLVKNGAGTWVLSGANTYTGTTTLSGGTLSVSAIADTGTSNLGPSGAVSLASGTTLIYTGAGANTTARSFNVSTGSSSISISSSTGSLALNGAITGAFSQTLSKLGNGSLTLGGAVDNGSLILDAQAGLVQLGKTSSGSFHAVAGISNIATGATVRLGGNGGDQIFNGGFQTSFGLVNMSGGTLDLNGLNEAFDRLTGTGSVSNSASSTTSTLTLGNAGGTASFGGSMSNGSGVLALIKTGAGTQTLTGTPTLASYTLITSSTGITGTPTLDAAIIGYTLQVSGNTLNLVQTGTAYSLWAGGAAFDADSNGDGVKNGLAFLLGAANKDVNANALLPVPTENAGKLILTFDCLSSANRGTALLNLQYSKDLGITDAWSGHTAAVPGTAPTSTTVNSVTFTTTTNGPLIHVVAEVPASAASPGTSLFGRLNANTP